MSTFAVIAALLLFSGPAIAQVSAPDCKYPSLYDWSYNSLKQDPCLIAAYLGSTCHSGSYTVYPLAPTSLYYSPSVLESDPCVCNTVMYSLVSACSDCQGGLWSTWSQWTFNCSKTMIMSPVSFPNPVPSGTRIPQWALLDVTLAADWDSVKALSTGDSPEVGPGVLIGSSSTASPLPGATAVTSSHSSPSSGSGSSSAPTPSQSGSGGSKVPVGAIVGAVVGGAAVIALVVLGVLYLRRPRQVAPSTAFMAQVPARPYSEVPQTPSNVPTPAPSSIPDTPSSTMRLYNPDDSSTYPGYHGSQYMPDVPPLPQHNGNENTLANMQMSRPGAYNGLPTV